MKRFLKYVIVFVLFLLPIFVQAQPEKIKSTEQQKRELAARQEQRKRDDLAAEGLLKKQHIKNQERHTRKRMRKSKRKAKRNNLNRREFFLKRWFGKKK